MKPIEYPRNRFATPFNDATPTPNIQRYVCTCGAQLKLIGTKDEIKKSLKEAIKDSKEQTKYLQQLIKELD